MGPLSATVRFAPLLGSALLLFTAGAIPASGEFRSSVPFGLRPARVSVPVLADFPLATRPGSPAGTPDGTWHEFGLLQSENQAAFYDPAKDRLITLGGNRDAAWHIPLSGKIAWEEVVRIEAQPWPFGWWGSAAEPSSGHVYFQAIGPGQTLVICRVHATTGEFEPIWATNAPTYWPYMTLAHDPSNHRFLVFGGQNLQTFELLDDVWVLDLLPTPAWSRWEPAGTSPGGRIGPAMVPDPVRNRLIVIGGLSLAGPGAWALTLDGNPTWSQLAATNLPGDGNVNGMVYDASTDRILALHGSGDVWAFSLNANEWSVLPVEGPGPAPRACVQLVLDPARHRLLLAGGRASDESDLCNDAWALSLDGPPRWTNLIPSITRPPVRGGAGDGYDASRHRMVVFGGAATQQVPEDPPYRNDTWALDLGGPTPAWSPIVTAGTPPPPRYWHSSAYDPIRDQLVVFGGYGSQEPPYNLFSDLWTLSFAGGTPTWTAHDPPGSRPGARSLANLVYDSTDDRFILLFGDGGAAAVADVWELRFTPAPAWRKMFPVGTAPEARAAAMAAHDPIRDRIMVFGGGNQIGPREDTWWLDLNVGDGWWHGQQLLSHPSPRTLGLLRLDTTRDRMLLFGGGQEVDFMNDVWELSFPAGGAQWRSLAPIGASPPPRDRATGAYDPVYERLVIAGGGWHGSNDTWALEFNDEATPTLLSLRSVDANPDRVRLAWAGADPWAVVGLERRAAGGGWEARAGLNADGGGQILFEDRDVTPGLRLEYRLTLLEGGAVIHVGHASVVVPTWTLALSAAAASGAVTIDFRLPSGSPATLAVFDLAGRRIWSKDVGHLGAGEHRDQPRNLTLRPGLYFAHLTQTGDRRAARFAVLR